MRRALIGLLLAAGMVVVGNSSADAGCFGFGIGIGRGYVGNYGYGYRGYGYRGFGYRGFGYSAPYRSFYRPYYNYYPRTYIRYSAPYYPSYYYGGYGCAVNSPSVYSPGVVVAPVAPLYADASRAYGPDAMKEFMGVDRDFAKGALATRPLVVDVKPVDGRAIVAAPVEVKEESVPSNAAARERAETFVSFGDSKFGEQEYHSAAQRYRFAIEAAPDVAEAHFRQGFAYVASNRYELAAAAFRRGLNLDPLWVNSAFHVDDMYGRHVLAKGSHLDGLAKNALIDRGNADYFFLLGVMLHFDEQQERAKKFFERAEKLTEGDDSHIQAFLNPARPDARDAI